MSAHTAGPWRMMVSALVRDVPAPDESDMVAALIGASEADQKLIAAAPELAAALLEAESWMIEYGIGSNKVLYSIGAALAKAGLKKAGL